MRAVKDRGSMAVELAILTPVLVMLFLLLVFAGRIVNVKSQLDGAARDGARAASVARTFGDANSFAQQAVKASLDGTSDCLGDPAVVIDAAKTSWRPGGMITVRVSCQTDLTGLKILPIGGSIVRTGVATAPIDTYRRMDCSPGVPCKLAEED